jgi:lipoprotein-anchoring transpeptidase ErfK/SrfK
MIGNQTPLVQRDGKGVLTISRVVVGILIAAAACLPQPASAVIDTPAPAVGENSAVPSSPVDEESVRVREALRQEIPRLITDDPKREQVWIERTQAAIAAGGYTIGGPQLLVVVDRNPRVQQMRIVLARSDGPWQSLGGTKVSTGRPGRFEHFLTPTGVFRHTAAILDWRAEGTFNEHHVRGLGLEGMRVWDFGWQRAVRGWGRSGVSKMRLLLHATDPATLERRIGRAASDGCVRIPTEMNRFLDAHGVLDRDYEQAARKKVRFASLLLPGRTPTPLAGDALVIIDSSENPSTPR